MRTHVVTAVTVLIVHPDDQSPQEVADAVERAVLDIADSSSWGVSVATATAGPEAVMHPDDEQAAADPNSVDGVPAWNQP